MKVAVAIGALAFVVSGAWGQVRLGVRVGTPQTPKTGAFIDFTGYWVSIVAEDARLRILRPAKGDFAGIPLSAEGLKLAGAWDPIRDEASGEPCKPYGAAAIMGIPGRFHITWDDDATLKIETEGGTQTRLLHFNAPPLETEAPSWQGYSVARWDATLKHGLQGGSLKVTTTSLRAGVSTQERRPVQRGNHPHRILRSDPRSRWHRARREFDSGGSGLFDGTVPDQHEPAETGGRLGVESERVLGKIARREHNLFRHTTVVSVPAPPKPPSAQMTNSPPWLQRGEFAKLGAVRAMPAHGPVLSATGRSSQKRAL